MALALKQSCGKWPFGSGSWGPLDHTCSTYRLLSLWDDAGI